MLIVFLCDFVTIKNKMKIGCSKDRTRLYGAPALLFLSFLAGCVLFYVRPTPEGYLCRISFPLLGALLVFCGSSAYGMLLTPVVLLLFGLHTAFSISQLPPSVSSVTGKISAVRELFPWYPALFCASYLGLVSSRKLLSDRIEDNKRLKNCILTGILQLLLMTGAAVISRMIAML